MAKFRQVEMRIERTSQYGRYLLRSKLRGKEINVITTDSEIFDWLEDDSNKTKHNEAKRAAYMIIRNEYSNQYE